MAQQLIVGVIVATAALYALWRWMPAGWRRAAAQRLGSATQRAGLVDAERAGRLAASLAKPSGCGACDTCGGCGKAAGAVVSPATATAASATTSGAPHAGAR